MLPVVLFEETSPHDPMLTNSFDRLREGDALSVFVMFSTPDADELLTHARAHPEATLYILDIDLPQTRDGIALWREISSLNPSAYGVFTSAHSHFALACLRAHAFDFLVKPFTYEDLKSTVRAVLDDLSVRRARLPMSIPLGDHTLQVDQNDVVSLHTHGNLVCCRLTDGKYSWRESLSAVLERLGTASLRARQPLVRRERAPYSDHGLGRKPAHHGRRPNPSRLPAHEIRPSRRDFFVNPSRGTVIPRQCAQGRTSPPTR